MTSIDPTGVGLRVLTDEQLCSLLDEAPSAETERGNRIHQVLVRECRRRLVERRNIPATENVDDLLKLLGIEQKFESPELRVAAEAAVAAGRKTESHFGAVETFVDLERNRALQGSKGIPACWGDWDMSKRTVTFDDGDTYDLAGEKVSS